MHDPILMKPLVVLLRLAIWQTSFFFQSHIEKANKRFIPPCLDVSLCLVSRRLRDLADGHYFQMK